MNNEQKIFFTVKDVEHLATSSSFDRGYDYFESGEVLKIERNGNLFEGTVYGSRKYKVSLDISNNELNFRCNCPYDFGGICKHEVAFALEILEGKYANKTIQEQKPHSQKEFNIKFDEAKKSKKLKFLKQLLDRDTNLQQQFIEFTKDISESLDNVVGEKIDIVKNKIHYELSELDFENIEDEYHHHYDYWDDEGMYNYADDMIQDTFTPYLNEAASYLEKGNLLDGIRITLGIYEGSQNLPELDNDDYCIFDGEYNSSVRSILMNIVNKIASKIYDIVKADEVVLQIMNLIFERIKLYNIGKEVENDEGAIFYSIKDFEKLFEALIANKTTATYLYQQLQSNKLVNKGASYIILNIAKILDDEILWIDTAETFSPNDKTIAMQLIEEYKLKEMETDFNRIAKMAFHKWADDFDLYLINNLDIEKQKKLYLKALKNYVRNKQKIRYYDVLRNHFTEDEKVKFVNNFKDGYNTTFYVQLLELEKRYKEILDCANQNANSGELEKLITPILNIYPSECFALIVNKNNSALNSHGRDRRTYQSMMRTLKLLKQITSKQKETTLYLGKLYNHKPNLPALKDEMRKANLDTNLTN
ncbi:MAG: hypothetical protein L3J41_08200 [Melioribacteraceae bacterium]|nr:hypothetical protein [Melioribacteraceae bacterium]